MSSAARAAERHASPNAARMLARGDGTFQETILQPRGPPRAACQVEAVDLLGGLMLKVSGHLGQKPTGAPGLLHAIGEDHYRRIEAVELTVKHEDGPAPQELPEADVIRVGVSRTSKTPLSVYLAQKGLCVANVPLVLGVDPPAELEDCHRDRVFGLTIGADPLVRIGSARLKHLGMTKDSTYGTLEHIKKELEYAKATSARAPCGR